MTTIQAGVKAVGRFVGLLSVLVFGVLTACPAQTPDGVSIDDTTLLSYSMKEVPIRLQNVNATAAQMTIGYDPSVVRIYGVTLTQGQLDTALVDSARFTFSVIDTAGFNNGVLGYISAEGLVPTSATTTLAFQSVLIDSGAQVPLTDGVISVYGTEVADLNDDGRETLADAKILLWEVTRFSANFLEGMHPRWYLERANVYEDYNESGYPRLDIFDVVMLLRRL